LAVDVAESIEQLSSWYCEEWVQSTISQWQCWAWIL